MSTNKNEIKIYQAYVLMKTDHSKTVQEVANEFGITRNGVYEIVRRIEGGNVAKIRKCKAEANLQCLWEYKYKARYLALPKDRKESTIKALQTLIKEMAKDTFPVAQIARRIGKDRSTVIHHLD